MKYIYDDAGKQYSKRPKQKADCAVRAYSIATGMPYDEAYDLFKTYGRKCFAGTEYKIIDRIYKGVAYYYSASLHYGYPSVQDILKLMKKGKYIVAMEAHVFAVIDGNIHDTYPLEKYLHKPVEGFWQIK